MTQQTSTRRRPSSRLSGFYQRKLPERVGAVAQWAGLSTDEQAVLLGMTGLNTTQADQMIENVIGTYALPMGIAVNFLINGQDYLIPMVVEEPSVVAACSFAARLIRDGFIRRGHIGIAAQDVPLPRRVVRFHNLPVESGLRVEEVQPSSPAAAAGLLRGDIIIEFDGRPVAGIDHLHRWLAETEADAQSTVVILRGAEKLTLEVRPKTEP